MKKEEDVFKQFRESFSKLEGHFHILEQQVPVQQQMEYFKYSENLRKQDLTEPLTDEECEVVFSLLQLEEAPEQEKKHLLCTLATSKSVKAYRLLEGYVQHPDDKVADWAYMALMELRISLESEFTDEKQIYISTGLGGKNEKLRFFVLIASHNKHPFEEYQRHVIEREFPYMLTRENCDIERLSVKEYWLEMIFLVPIRSDIKGIMDKVIIECNQYGDFLSHVFTITNVKELNQKEIDEVLAKEGISN